MNRAPKEQTGLALGAWGAVQATAAGVAVALGGVLRDIVAALADAGIVRRGAVAAGDRLCFCLCASKSCCWSSTIFVMGASGRRHAAAVDGAAGAAPAGGSDDA